MPDTIIIEVDDNNIFTHSFDKESPCWGPDNDVNLFFLKCTRNYLNDMLITRGHVLLNEVYDRLGFPRTKEGALFGWTGDSSIEFFDTTTKFVDDGIPLKFVTDGVIIDKI